MRPVRVHPALPLRIRVDGPSLAADFSSRPRTDGSAAPCASGDALPCFPASPPSVLSGPPCTRSLGWAACPLGSPAGLRLPEGMDAEVEGRVQAVLFGGEADKGGSSLVLTAECGDVVAVDAVLDVGGGVRVDERTDTGDTLLICAARAGQHAMVARLLRRGADVHARNVFESTALHEAARHGRVVACQRLLEAGASPERAGEKGETPLHCAVRSGSRAVVRLMLKAGADVNAANLYADTPLHLAAAAGQGHLVRALLGEGAHPNVVDEYLATPLHQACEAGSLQAVAALCAQGAAVGAKDDAGLTPLMEAARHGHAGVVRLLLQAPRLLVDARDGSCDTALHKACLAGHADVVHHLLSASASVHAVNRAGRTPLHCAALATSAPCAHLLLRKGASPLAQDHSGATTLHHAAAEGASDVARLLLDAAGGQVILLVGLPDARGQSALLLASRAESGDTVQLLLCHGAATSEQALQALPRSPKVRRLLQWGPACPWTAETHRLTPQRFRAAVRALLLAATADAKLEAPCGLERVLREGDLVRIIAGMAHPWGLWLISNGPLPKTNERHARPNYVHASLDTHQP